MNQFWNLNKVIYEINPISPVLIKKSEKKSFSIKNAICL